VTSALFITTQAQATDSYTALSHAVVLATVSPDLIDTIKIDPRPFARCFKALGLTENDLKATSRLVLLDRVSSVASTASLVCRYSDDWTNSLTFIWLFSRTERAVVPT
jgi:hypothetical protein